VVAAYVPQGNTTPLNPDLLKQRFGTVEAEHILQQWAKGNAPHRAQAQGMLAYNNADMPILFMLSGVRQYYLPTIIILDANGVVVDALDFDTVAIRAALDRVVMQDK
jgi:hypothetical protein